MCIFTPFHGATATFDRLRVPPAGIKLTGGIGSKWQGIYCLEVVPGSPASEEGSVQPNDKILYICGRCTLGMTLEDAVKACEAAPRKVKLKVLRCVTLKRGGRGVGLLFRVSD